jgi:hypothetical protein
MLDVNLKEVFAFSEDAALGARITEEVHNHHNFAWCEKHGGRDLWIASADLSAARSVRSR